MNTHTCTVCGASFQGRAQARTCSDRCRKALSRREADRPPLRLPGGQTSHLRWAEVRQNDRRAELLDLIATASGADRARISEMISPVHIDHVGLEPVELRRQYGSKADLSGVMKLRGLPTAAPLLQFLDEGEAVA